MNNEHSNADQTLSAQRSALKTSALSAQRQTSSLALALRSSPWLIVVGSALAMSWWSLFELALSYDVPLVLAIGVSTIYDGAALVLGDLARRYAMTTDSGLVPRIGMFVLVLLSAWLNQRHAILLGLALPGQVLFSAPSLVAGAVWELMRRWEHREAMRAVGRVSEALPVLGRWSWMLFPWRSLGTQRSLIGAQLSAVALNATPQCSALERSAGCTDTVLDTQHLMSAERSMLSIETRMSTEVSAQRSALSAQHSGDAEMSAHIERQESRVSTMVSSRRQMIDSAISVLGCGSDVTAPILAAWITEQHPDVSIGASTIRARLSQYRNQQT